MLINPYNPEVKFKNFPDLDSKLLAHYDRLYHTVTDLEITPRYFYEIGLKIGFRDLFYYIDHLYDNQPTSVIDVGCGECIWKKWFPNIIGFDPNTNEFSDQDFIDYFDEDFSKGHTKNWDSGMALNSIHFVNWDQVPRQIELAMNIVRDQFLFTFNFRMIQNKPDLPMDDLISAFNNLLKSLPYKIILLDYPIQRGISKIQLDHWSHANGHVRFILSNTQPGATNEQ
jgi:hypothetical protein